VKKGGAWVIVCACLLVAQLSAQQVQLTIPDTTGAIGDTLLIPIITSTIALTDSVYSGQFTLEYDSTVIMVSSVELSNSLLAGYGTTLFNAGTRKMVFAGVMPLTGAGTLLFLKTAVLGNPGDHTAIALTIARLNEGNPAVEVTNGSIQVLALPGAPVLVAPIDQESNVDTDVRLVWYATPHSTSYEVQVATDSTFLVRFADAANVIDTAFVVRSLEWNTKYFWRVRATNAGLTGPFSRVSSFQTAIQAGTGKSPERSRLEYDLLQNYPNPFNPNTAIRYVLKSKSTVRLDIYDILGQKVEGLVNEAQNAGYHSVTWNPAVPSGAYFYRIEAKSLIDPGDSFIQIRKMILMK